MEGEIDHGHFMGYRMQKMSIYEDSSKGIVAVDSEGRMEDAVVFFKFNLEV